MTVDNSSRHARSPAGSRGAPETNGTQIFPLPPRPTDDGARPDAASPAASVASTSASTIARGVSVLATVGIGGAAPVGAPPRPPRKAKPARTAHEPTRIFVISPTPAAATVEAKPGSETPSAAPPHEEVSRRTATFSSPPFAPVPNSKVIARSVAKPVVDSSSSPKPSPARASSAFEDGRKRATTWSTATTVNAPVGTLMESEGNNADARAVKAQSGPIEVLDRKVKARARALFSRERSSSPVATAAPGGSRARSIGLRVAAFAAAAALVLGSGTLVGRGIAMRAGSEHPAASASASASASAQPASATPAQGATAAPARAAGTASAESEIAAPATPTSAAGAAITAAAAITRAAAVTAAAAVATTAASALGATPAATGVAQAPAVRVAAVPDVTSNTTASNTTASNTAASNTAASNTAASNTAASNTAASNTAASNTAASNTAASNTAASNTAASNTAASNTAASNTAASNTAASNTAASNTAASNTAASNTVAEAVPAETAESSESERAPVVRPVARADASAPERGAPAGATLARRAVDALLAGDRERALLHYRELSRTFPDRDAYREAARLLAASTPGATR